MLLIKLNSIFSLEMDVIATEETLPSFNALLNISFFNTFGTKSISFASIWYENKRWEQFIHALNKMPDTDATLSDMSEKFVLHIGSNNNGILLSVKINERYQGEFITIDYQKNLDLDQFAILKNGFIGFEK